MLLKPKEVAELLRVSVMTVRRMARDGRLPAIWVGKTARFEEAAIRKKLGKPAK
jgi:excisionase family DNA binding protein